MSETVKHRINSRLMVITEQSNCNIVIFVKIHVRTRGKNRKTLSIGFYDEFPEISRQFRGARRCLRPPTCGFRGVTDTIKKSL